MAYFKRAKECHPDLHGDARRDEFQKLSEAYSILSDPQKKKLYDASGYRDSSTSQQQGQYRYREPNVDEQMDAAMEQFWKVWMDFGVQDYFETLQKDMQAAYDASVRDGNVGPLYDFAMKNKGIVLAILVPAIVVFRFPFLAVAVGKSSFMALTSENWSLTKKCCKLYDRPVRVNYCSGSNPNRHAKSRDCCTHR